MRIISGKHKGRKLKVSKAFNSRPTTDMAKEALFNILQSQYDIHDKSVLDLFSGTGSIGVEFVSREAAEVCFVEQNGRACKSISENLDMLHEEAHTVLRSDAVRFAETSGRQFDFIFADPPFDFKNYEGLVSAVTRNLMHTDSVFILEHPDGVDFSEHPNYTVTRTYGKVNFSIFEIQQP